MRSHREPCTCRLCNGPLWVGEGYALEEHVRIWCLRADPVLQAGGGCATWVSRWISCIPFIAQPKSNGVGTRLKVPRAERAAAGGQRCSQQGIAARSIPRGSDQGTQRPTSRGRRVVNCVPARRDAQPLVPGCLRSRRVRPCGSARSSASQVPNYRPARSLLAKSRWSAQLLRRRVSTSRSARDLAAAAPYGTCVAAGLPGGCPARSATRSDPMTTASG